MLNSMQNSTRTIDRTGQQLKDYRLVRALSLGRTSGIYLGEHALRRMQYLVYVWETRLEAAQVGNFLKQARALSELRHSNILPVRDAGVDELLPFVVMDYVPHITLKQRGSRGTPQPLAQFLPFLSPLASALYYAHSRGILHKHVQPANILLDSHQRVLLSNFAIDTVDLTSHQPLILTKEDAAESMGYLAPEQIEGKAYPASDQYGLAVIVYEWLSGTLPFRGSYAEIARQQKHKQPPSLYPNIPGVSHTVEDTLFAALAKDPAQRFPGVTLFVEALQKASGKPAASMFPVAQNAMPAPQPPVAARPAMMGASAQSSAPITPVSAPQLPLPRTPHLPTTDPNVTRQAVSTPARKTQQKPGVTRRAFIAGLVGVAVIGGAAAWLEFGRGLPGSLPGSSGTPGAGSPHPAQPAPGNIFTYRAHTARVGAVAWSPDGTRIASASDDHAVLICDAQKGQTTLTYGGHNGPVLALAWSPDGKYIASGGADTTVQVWDATTGKTVSTYTGHSKQVNAVSWAHTSNLIASGSEDRTVQVWNAMTREIFFTYTGHKAGVLATAWSPDDSSIATGSWDNTVRAVAAVATQSFNVGDTIFIYEGHAAEVYSVAWSPSGKQLASASGDRFVTVHNGLNGNTIFNYEGHSDIVYAVAWSPDGARLASASADNTAQVWSARTTQHVLRQSLFTYNGHSNIVYAVAWSPNSRRLASGSADTTMQVWHMV